MSKYERSVIKRSEVRKWLYQTCTAEDRNRMLEACLVRLMECEEIRFRQDDIDIEENSVGFYWDSNGELLTEAGSD